MSGKEYRKMRGRCVLCGKREPFDNRMLCEYCIEKKAEYNARYNAKRKADNERRKEYNAYMRNLKKRIAQERVDKGLCGYCGKYVPRSGRKMCDVCAEVARVRLLRYREDKKNAI